MGYGYFTIYRLSNIGPPLCTSWVIFDLYNQREKIRCGSFFTHTIIKIVKNEKEDNVPKLSMLVDHGYHNIFLFCFLRSHLDNILGYLKGNNTLAPKSIKINSLNITSNGIFQDAFDLNCTLILIFWMSISAVHRIDLETATHTVNLAGHLS